MQTFLMVVVILVLMTPLLLFYGLPFIVAARLFHALTARHFGERTRLVAACGIAAIGLAPAFDAFWMPKSIYLDWLQSNSVDPRAALLSFGVTWLVVTLQVRLLAHRHSLRTKGNHGFVGNRHMRVDK